jgi:hypothetical protein
MDNHEQNLRRDIETLRADVKRDIEVLRAELKKDIAEVNQRIAESKAELRGKACIAWSSAPHSPWLPRRDREPVCPS